MKTENKCHVCKAEGEFHGTRCTTCNKEYLKPWRQRREDKPSKLTQTSPDKPRPPQASKIAKPQKPLSSDTPDVAELIVDLPGIYGVENRGKGYTSFRFESPVDGSVFAFESFKEARKERQQMMSAFRQQAVFESVHRQSTGKKLAVDDEDDK